MVAKENLSNHILQSYVREDKPRTKQTQFNDSMTGVNPTRTHGVGVWGGRRKVVGIRIDEKLYKAVKPILLGVFGSVCRPVESLFATIYSCYNNKNLEVDGGVNPSLTIKIENMNIQRNLRSRRRLIVEEETEVTETKTITCSWCHKPAVAVVKNEATGESHYACEFHKGLVETQPSWTFVEEVAQGR